MMRRLGPVVLSWLIYVAFKNMYSHQRVDKKLLLEALYFSLITAVLMHVYLQMFGYIEGMTTFGSTCPNGYIMVDDPMDSKQQTCKPVGHPTYPTDMKSAKA